MKRSLSGLLLTFFALVALVVPVFAQDSPYILHPRREFGYGAGSNVRGSFSMNITGADAAASQNIQSVTYQIDSKVMATVTEPPFKYNFKTSAYSDGWHTFTAVVETKDGRKFNTQTVRLNFLSADAESQSMQRILIPLLGGVFLVIIIVSGLQFILVRKQGPLQPGMHRSYGIKGGAICPRCGRPYPIHVFSINLIGGYFDRCDYCGKWAFVKSRSRADLEAAEQAEIRAAGLSESAIPGLNVQETEADRLRKMLDESRYKD